MELWIVEHINGDIVDDAGGQYTFSVSLLYESHNIKETFEIGRLKKSEAFILRYWWNLKQKACSRVTEQNDKLLFTSKHCHQHCTKAVVCSFSRDDYYSKLKFRSDHQ
jgi:hypothetical protein